MADELIILVVAMVIFFETAQTTDPCYWTASGLNGALYKRSFGSSGSFEANVSATDLYLVDPFKWMYTLDSVEHTLIAWTGPATQTDGKINFTTDEACSARNCEILNNKTDAKAWIDGKEDMVSMSIYFPRLDSVNKATLYAFASPCPTDAKKSPYATISLGYCPGNITNDVGQTLMVVPQYGRAKYNVTGKCSCVNESKGELYTKAGEPFEGSARCDELAHWDGCTKAECWYSPIVRLSSQNVSGNITVLDGSTVEMMCEEVGSGYPRDGTIFYFQDSNVVNESITVGPKDHDSELQCQLRNSYVIAKENKIGKSNSIILNVIFRPYSNGSLQSEQYASKGQDYNLTFIFYANPCLNESYVDLNFKNETLHDRHTISCGKDTMQEFIHKIASVNDSDFGQYFLRTESPNTDLKQREMTFSVTLLDETDKPTSSTTDTTEKSRNLGTGVIIGICVAAVIALILLFVLIWKIRQDQKKKTDLLTATNTNKEDRLNEIYDSAGNQRTEHLTGTGHIKEEKANVLYGTSDVAVGIEEAYAEVDRKKKKGKSKGSENSAFRPEAEVTYAAVNKPKKKTGSQHEDVYSKVDKGAKRNDKDSGLNDL